MGRLVRCHAHAMRQLLLVALLCGCAKAEAHECVEQTVEKPPALDQIRLTKAKWSELPGWADDKHHEAVPAFIVSCVKLAELKDDDLVGVDGHGGKAKQWRGACDKASKLKQGDNKAARELLNRLKQLLVINWCQKSTARSQLKLAIEDALDSGLQRAYSPEIYHQKCSAPNSLIRW